MIIFDTETTGLLDTHLMPLEKQPEIIELYMCDVDLNTGEIGYEFDHMFKPVKPVTDEITKITGITNAMLVDKEPFGAYQKEIAEAFARTDGICAHNLSYDMEMLAIEYERMGRGNTLIFPRRKLCTVEATVHLKGFRLSLTALHEHLFNEKFPEAHRAKTDVMALVRCAVELRKREEI